MVLVANAGARASTTAAISAPGTGQSSRDAGVHIAQHLIGGQRAGLNDLIVDRHARRLARVIVDDSLAANAIGAQTLEDRVLGEYLGDPFGLLRVDCRLASSLGVMVRELATTA